MANKKLLIVCGSGGHAAQALILYRDLKDVFSCSFLLETSDPLTAGKIGDAPVYRAVAVRGKREPKVRMIARLSRCTIQSFRVFRQVRPDVIVSTGPGLAGPICLWGKLFGKKVIFIESWSRVTTRSWPGKILYRVADRFFIQWPDQEQKYPKATYAGRLG